jgi:hypothetical protein
MAPPSQELEPPINPGRFIPTAELRSWRVSIRWQHAQYLGVVEAPTERAAQAVAVAQFSLTEEQRRRLAVEERE